MTDGDTDSMPSSWWYQPNGGLWLPFLVAFAKALEHAPISSRGRVPALLPLSARLRGERERPTPHGSAQSAARGQAPAWEGEVGRAANQSLLLPPPHPNPLRPRGRRGGYLRSGSVWPSAKAGAQGHRRRARALDARFPRA